MLPCKSILYIEGRLSLKERNVQKQPNLEFNCVTFMFDEIRYEMIWRLIITETLE